MAPRPRERAASAGCRETRSGHDASSNPSLSSRRQRPHSQSRPVSAQTGAARNRPASAYKTRGNVLCNARAIEIAGAPLHADPELVLEAIALNGKGLKAASERLQGDRAFVLKAVQRNGLALECAQVGLKSDREVVIAAVRQNGLALRYASYALRNDVDIVLLAIQGDERAIHFAAESAKADRECVAAADSSGRLRQDREYVLSMVKARGRALRTAHVRWRADSEVVMLAVSNDGLALEFVVSRLKQDESIVLAAVRQNGLALAHAPPRFRRNPTVVTKAVCQNGLALQYASESLRNDTVIVRNAVKNCGHSIEFASEKLKADRQVVLCAVKGDGLALQHANETIRDDMNVVFEAAMQCIAALSYASSRLQDDPDLRAKITRAAEVKAAKYEERNALAAQQMEKEELEQKRKLIASRDKKELSHPQSPSRAETSGTPSLMRPRSASVGAFFRKYMDMAKDWAATHAGVELQKDSRPKPLEDPSDWGSEVSEQPPPPPPLPPSLVDAPRSPPKRDAIAEFCENLEKRAAEIQPRPRSAKSRRPVSATMRSRRLRPTSPHGRERAVMKARPYSACSAPCLGLSDGDCTPVRRRIPRPISAPI
eukprot:TRINITY_DN48450_c0_g1_i1.p1 TRINITY_DN48450_c0_g1~~TRINITY_DN48450_c0_g1_i1.p1  ORF type:complete len:600 (-),score=95.72 TRINITY_DN48450_c0_g1_i1:240-2039(-)